MKAISKIAALLLAVCIAVLFTGCGGNENNLSSSGADLAEKTKINIAALKGPTGIGMARLMEQNENGETANDYNFTVSGAPDDVTAKLINGEYDIAAVPTNNAAMLYNKTNGDIKMLALNTKGVLYMLDSTNSIKSVSDLRGKKIYATGKGSTP